MYTTLGYWVLADKDHKREGKEQPGATLSILAVFFFFSFLPLPSYLTA